MENKRIKEDNLSDYEGEGISGRIPGGMAKIVLDDRLTLLHATEDFYDLIQGSSSAEGEGPLLTLNKVVYSADIIDLTRQLARQRQRGDDMLHLHLRILRTEGGFRWIMISGRAIGQTYKVGTSKLPIYDCIAVDATYYMEEYRGIERELSYQQIISDLARDIFFVYDIALDKMVFKEIFREIFGKENVIENFGYRLKHTNIVHPKDLAGVERIYKSMMTGRKQAKFEVQLLSKEGTMGTYICYASIIYDDNKNPHRVVGKLSSSIRQETVQQTPESSIDYETKVSTKEMAQTMISEQLAYQEEGILSALMMLEVRNYKIVNDVMESMGKEKIIVTIAKMLQSMFRYSDIIGRTEANGFIIFMKNVKDEKTVEEMAQEICTKVEGLYSFDQTRNGLNVSIGISLAKGSGVAYTSLSAGSREALLSAKRKTTGSYVVNR